MDIQKLKNMVQYLLRLRKECRPIIDRLRRTGQEAHKECRPIVDRLRRTGSTYSILASPKRSISGCSAGGSARG